MKLNDDQIKLAATVIIAVVLGLVLSLSGILPGKNQNKQEGKETNKPTGTEAMIAVTPETTQQSTTTQPASTPEVIVSATLLPGLTETATEVPAVKVTFVPTSAPTATPTAEPTATPTATPTAEPTATPTATPTAEPTATPTSTPTAEPTPTPTATPTMVPTATPRPAAREVAIYKALAFATHEAMNNGISFEANHLLDRDDLTSWQYDITQTNGTAPYVIFELETAADLTAIGIRNGYWKISGQYDQYTRNGRVKDFEVSFLYVGEGTYTDAMRFNLVDQKIEQTFELGLLENVTSIKLTILNVYKGTKFKNDVAMNDVKLIGYPR